MVVKAATTELLNKLRDTIDSEVTQIAVGTGTTDPTKNDTSLQTLVLKKAVSGSTTTSQEVEHEMRLGTSEANGNDLAEAGDLDAADNLEARWTHSPISKTNSIEVIYRTKKTTQNP